MNFGATPPRSDSEPDWEEIDTIQHGPPGSERSRLTYRLRPVGAVVAVIAVGGLAVFLSRPSGHGHTSPAPGPISTPATTATSSTSRVPTAANTSVMPSTGRASAAPGPGISLGTVTGHAVVGPTVRATAGVPTTGTTRSTGGGAGGTTSAPPTSSVGSRVEEAYNRHGVPTFADYANASSPGQTIAFQQMVRVACKIYDPSIGSTRPGGYWYRIESPPWNGAYYAVANTFLNGDPPNGPYSHDVDPAVSDC